MSFVGVMRRDPLLAVLSAAFFIPAVWAGISNEEIQAAQKAWGDGIVEIGSLKDKPKECREKAEAFVDEMYAYKTSTVLHKPTQELDSANATYRLGRDDAIAHLVGSLGAAEGAASEAQGFALKPWKSVRFENAGYLLQGDIAMVMGDVHFMDSTGVEMKTQHSFGYSKDSSGKLRITLQHASTPSKEGAVASPAAADSTPAAASGDAKAAEASSTASPKKEEESSTTAEAKKETETSSTTSSTTESTTTKEASTTKEEVKLPTPGSASAAQAADARPVDDEATRKKKAKELADEVKKNHHVLEKDPKSEGKKGHGIPSHAAPKTDETNSSGGGILKAIMYIIIVFVLFSAFAISQVTPTPRMSLVDRWISGMTLLSRKSGLGANTTILPSGGAYGGPRKRGD